MAVVAIVLSSYLVGSLLHKKITASLNEKYPDYTFDIEKVHWSLIPSSLSLHTITISSKANASSARYLNGEIDVLQLKGMRFAKAAFKNEYEINEIIISNSRLTGTILFQDKKRIPTVSTLNFRAGNIVFDKIHLALKDSSSSQTLSINEGVLKITEFEIKEKDTLGLINRFDFKAKEVLFVSPDSMYTYRVNGIAYSDSAKTLAMESLSIGPNYEAYDFTSRYPYETDRIEAKVSQVNLHHFSAPGYYNHGNLAGSYLSIGNLEVDVFRDKRKNDDLRKKPLFQHYINTYPGLLHMDSIGVNDGIISYTEQAEQAAKPGVVSMNKLKARIYNISNDTAFKSKEAFMEMKAEALLMEKSKLTVSLKARLFDPLNTFTLKGTLAPLEVKELNPILVNNAFITAHTAKTGMVSFNFTANDTRATGEIILPYNGLDLTVVDKQTNNAKALKEQFISFIADKGTYDSNPLPSEDVRVGIIKYERDTTKFIFNYWVKAILSGVKSTIIKAPVKRKSFLRRLFSSREENQKE